MVARRQIDVCVVVRIIAKDIVMARVTGCSRTGIACAQKFCVWESLNFLQLSTPWLSITPLIKTEDALKERNALMAQVVALHERMRLQTIDNLTQNAGGCMLLVIDCTSVLMTAMGERERTCARARTCVYVCVCVRACVS